MTVTTASTEGFVAPIDEQQVVRKIAWRLMPLIIICYLFAFFDRVNISFAKTALQADLGLSNTAYGFGASLFVVGYVLLEVPSNLLLYRFGARRWIARIMISWGLATAAMVFVSSEWQFYGLRFRDRRDGGRLRAGHPVLPDAVVSQGLSRPRQLRSSSSPPPSPASSARPSRA
jgi:MFS family permease